MKSPRFPANSSNKPPLFWGLWALAALGVAFIRLPATTSDPAVRHFRIVASAFEFHPAILEVNPGDRVTIELVSLDVVHGLYLDGYDLEVVAEPGQPGRVEFIAERSGTVRFRCAVTCGALHPFMIGKLKVGGDAPLWRGVGYIFLAAMAGLWGIRK